MLVNDCILMYLEIIILNIYNFLIPYEYLFIYLIFFFYTLISASIGSQVRPCLYLMFSTSAPKKKKNSGQNAK